MWQTAVLIIGHYSTWVVALKWIKGVEGAYAENIYTIFIPRPLTFMLHLRRSAILIPYLTSHFSITYCQSLLLGSAKQFRRTKGVPKLRAKTQRGKEFGDYRSTMTELSNRLKEGPNQTTAAIELRNVTKRFRTPTGQVSILRYV